MKIRSVVALVGLAISFGMPTFAQQKEPTPSDENRQVSAGLVKHGDEAWNNNDATAVAAIFTEDAVIVTDSGPIDGREAIEKWAADLFKQVHFSNHLSKDDPVSPHAVGNKLWCNGQWSQTIKGQNWGPIEQKGYYSAIDSREGDTWKLRMLTFNVTPPTASTGRDTLPNRQIASCLLGSRGGAASFGGRCRKHCRGSLYLGATLSCPDSSSRAAQSECL